MKTLISCRANHAKSQIEILGFVWMLVCLHYVVKLNLGILVIAMEGLHYSNNQQPHLH